MDTYIIVIGLGLLFWGLTMLAIVNVISKDFGSIQYKAFWGFIALIPFVGWSIYFIFGAKRGINKRVKGKE
ncbi:MAG: PLDc N-terminal domain-containing protein [Desulfamplus sp.]|nr:PLDc N-terminal domain-containing protein [Desulfamplus sp.]